MFESRRRKRRKGRGRRRKRRKGRRRRRKRRKGRGRRRKRRKGRRRRRRRRVRVFEGDSGAAGDKSNMKRNNKEVVLINR